MSDMDRTPAEVIAFAEENGVDMVDLKLVDLPGAMRHVTVPFGRLTEELFADGAAFDGSSIRGFQADGGDLLLIPDPATAAVDPVPEVPTLSLICDVRDPATGGRHPRDPRWIAQKAERYLRTSGMADASCWGAAPQFFILDAQSDQGDDGGLNIGEPNPADTPRNGGSRPAGPPVDTTTNIRSEVAIKLAGFGVEVESHRHGEAAAGHGEIVFESDSLTRGADDVLICKYLLKGTARDYGRAATFMPKPLLGDASAGMHTRQSLWKDGHNLFHGDGYAGMSELMANYIGGLLAHAPALLAFCAPGTNSYRRLAPGLDAPVDPVYSTRSRSAAVRVPTHFAEPSARCVEFRPPDPTCNPYLAFSAMLMAGIDGILNGTDPGEPLDVEPNRLSADAPARTGRLPRSLDASLDALEADHNFLTRGNVFTDDLIGAWLEYKRSHEIEEVRRRPHPYELALYFDA